MKIQSLLSAVLLLGAGCTTVTISSPHSLDGVDVKGAVTRADRVISVGNDGYFLFGTYPVVAGDMSAWDPRSRVLRKGIRWFSDETALSKLNDVLFRYADSLDCDLADIVVNDRTEPRLGLFGVQDWFNGVFGLRNISVSGVLVPRK